MTESQGAILYRHGSSASLPFALLAGYGVYPDKLNTLVDDCACPLSPSDWVVGFWWNESKINTRSDTNAFDGKY